MAQLPVLEKTVLPRPIRPTSAHEYAWALIPWVPQIHALECRQESMGNRLNPTSKPRKDLMVKSKNLGLVRRQLDCQYCNSYERADESEAKDSVKRTWNPSPFASFSICVTAVASCASVGFSELARTVPKGSFTLSVFWPLLRLGNRNARVTPSEHLNNVQICHRIFGEL